MEQSQAYLFNVVEGPSHTPDDHASMLRLLSQRFTGELWSYGTYECDQTFGRMRLRVLKDPGRDRLQNFLQFSQQVMQRARQLRAAPPAAPLVVTSYDPFKGGLLAWRVARLLGSAFVCEVNGQYGDPDNFAHVSSPAWRALRLLQMRVLGSFVLHRANGVRLLFSEQLENFVTPGRATVLRNFFALSVTGRFRPGAEEPLVLSAGYPFERKGVDVLVSAFARVAAKYPQWRLVVIGHQVPQRLAASGLSHPQVEALPGIPQSQLAGWMGRCAIFALASRSEAMGRVLIEAAAAGKCRVATRVGGIPTVVEHGYDGLLVSKGSVEEMAAALDRLMGDAALRRRLGLTAGERVAREFSDESYLSLFAELIGASLSAFSANRGAPQA